MALSFDQALGTSVAALRVREARAQILSTNLANESTPGYQARDIDFGKALQHALADDSSVKNMRLDYRVPFQPSMDGNTVELAHEQAEFSKNANDFDMSLTFLNMRFQGLEDAIGKNR